MTGAPNRILEEFHCQLFFSISWNNRIFLEIQTNEVIREFCNKFSFKETICWITHQNSRRNCATNCLFSQIILEILIDLKEQPLRPSWVHNYILIRFLSENNMPRHQNPATNWFFLTKNSWNKRLKGSLKDWKPFHSCLTLFLSEVVTWYTMRGLIPPSPDRNRVIPLLVQKLWHKCQTCKKRKNLKKH